MMPGFDRVVIVDWSATRGPTKPGPDTIWIAVADAAGLTARHMATRPQAEALVAGQIADATATGKRLLVGFDFAFGYPRGFAAALGLPPQARAVWALLAGLVRETADHDSNRFEVAAGLNRQLGGNGPFWVVNPGLAGPGLPFGKTDRTPPAEYGIAEARQVDRHPEAAGAKTLWQLTGPGAVGSQSLTGLPMIHRLAQRPGVAVWPFDPPDAPVLLAEVYPSLLAPAVARDVAQGWVKDAAQVRNLALALWRLAQAGQLAPLLAAQGDAEEGWILGVGHRAALLAALA